MSVNHSVDQNYVHRTIMCCYTIIIETVSNWNIFKLCWVCYIAPTYLYSLYQLCITYNILHTMMIQHSSQTKIMFVSTIGQVYKRSPLIKQFDHRVIELLTKPIKYVSYIIYKVETTNKIIVPMNIPDIIFPLNFPHHKSRKSTNSSFFYPDRASINT